MESCNVVIMFFFNLKDPLELALFVTEKEDIAMMMLTCNYNSFKTVVNKICYLGFMVCGIFFSKHAIHEFRVGRTSFDTVAEPLKLGDLPLITICYDVSFKCDEALDSNIDYTLGIYG